MNAVMTLDREAVEGELSRFGVVTPRGDGWVLPPRGSRLDELFATPVGGVLELRMTLVSLAGVSEVSRRALGVFLAKAAKGLRVATVEVGEETADVFATVSIADVEQKLEDAANAVMAARQALDREALALTQEETAVAYELFNAP